MFDVHRGVEAGGPPAGWPRLSYPLIIATLTGLQMVQPKRD